MVESIHRASYAPLVPTARAPVWTRVGVCVGVCGVGRQVSVDRSRPSTADRMRIRIRTPPSLARRVPDHATQLHLGQRPSQATTYLAVRDGIVLGVVDVHPLALPVCPARLLLPSLLLLLQLVPERGLPVAGKRNKWRM